MNLTITSMTHKDKQLKNEKILGIAVWKEDCAIKN
jgi:hypothetical protein